MENQSSYDEKRKTVGAIYRDAQLHGERVKIETGDMSNVMMKCMVDDLNDTIKEGVKEFEGKEFYITVHEKKDAQMPSCLLRRMIKTLYRPWPEDDTIVFRILDAGNDVRFCWCIPHWSEMENQLNTYDLYEPEYINQMRSWKAYDLHCFGFVKTMDGHWIPDLNWQDQKLGHEKKRSALVHIA